MPSKKSPRNKTIDTLVSQGEEYLSRCIKIDNAVADISSVANKIVLGDTFLVAPNLPAHSFDLIIADPPYNVTKKFATNTFFKMSNDDYAQYTRRWLTLINPLLKPTGSVYVCCDWQTSLIIGRALEDFFKVRNRITWQRGKGRGSKTNWKSGLEDIWFATKSDTYTFNAEAVKVRRKVIAPYRVDGKPKDWHETAQGKFRDSCPSNFWDDVTVPFWSMAEKTAHPSQKAEKLMAKLILASSNPGDMIFDPFTGSGTACVVAKKLGRKYLGVDIEAQYCLWAQQRLEIADVDKKIQGYEGGVFWERNSLQTQKNFSEES